MGLLPDTENCGLHVCQECQERFPRHRGLAIPTCITARASRMCRDACQEAHATVIVLWHVQKFVVIWGTSVDLQQRDIDGLVQDCSIFIANALEILQSCAKPSVCSANCEPHYTTKLLGGILVSLRPSVRPSLIPCLLCSAYSSGWIHFIFMHLIKQLQKVCRV